MPELLLSVLAIRKLRQNKQCCNCCCQSTELFSLSNIVIQNIELWNPWFPSWSSFLFMDKVCVTPLHINWSCLATTGLQSSLYEHKCFIKSKIWKHLLSEFCKLLLCLRSITSLNRLWTLVLVGLCGLASFNSLLSVSQLLLKTLDVSFTIINDLRINYVIK